MRIIVNKLQKIKKIYICPECNNRAIDEGLCTLEEEYIKNIKEDYYFLEEAEDSTDFYLKGVIWLKKDLPGILECAHPSLVYSSSWKYTICEDCGLMLSPTKEALEKHEKEKIKKKIIEELISKGVIFDNIPGHGFILETLRKLKSSITFNSLERIAILNQSKNKIKELQKEEEE